MTLEPDTLSLPEAAARLGISERHARNLAKTGKLCEGVNIVRCGTSLRVPKAQLERVLGVEQVAS